MPIIPKSTSTYVAQGCQLLWSHPQTSFINVMYLNSNMFTSLSFWDKTLLRSLVWPQTHNSCASSFQVWYYRHTSPHPESSMDLNGMCPRNRAEKPCWVCLGILTLLRKQEAREVLKSGRMLRFDSFGADMFTRKASAKPSVSSFQGASLDTTWRLFHNKRILQLFKHFHL